MTAEEEPVLSPLDRLHSIVKSGYLQKMFFQFALVIYENDEYVKA